MSHAGFSFGGLCVGWQVERVNRAKQQVLIASSAVAQAEVTTSGRGLSSCHLHTWVC